MYTRKAIPNKQINNSTINENLNPEQVELNAIMVL